MSVLTTIGNIPVFNNTKDAIGWGSMFGLSGYHKHIFNGKTGYMAGENHSETIIAYKYKNPQQVIEPVVETVEEIVVEPVVEPDVIPPQQPLPPTPPTTTTTTGGGGGGGGY